MELNIEPSAVVITPTIGKLELTRAIRSVTTQSYCNLRHLIVVDGSEYDEKITNLVSSQIDISQHDVDIIVLPKNVGKNGMYGHRVYAAFPHLVNEEYVLFLDEDNWWDNNHVETLINKAEKNHLNWTYSLRKVYEAGNFLAADCCEAIGKWPIVWSDPPQYLVDTSAYCFKRNWLINFSYLWHYGWGGDRRFFMLVKDHGTYDTTGLHTLNYELPNMDKAYGGDREIFERNNLIMKTKHGGKYPWN